MTALPPAGRLRDELVAALPHESWCHYDMNCCGCNCEDARQLLADALLPAVARALTEARADELRDMAAALRGLGWQSVPTVLDNRESALRASIRQTDERNDR